MKKWRKYSDDFLFRANLQISEKLTSKVEKNIYIDKKKKIWNTFFRNISVLTELKKKL